MQPLSKRLAALERAHSPAVTLDSSSADLARFLARIPPQELQAELSGFSEADRVELYDEIRAHVPGYGASDARS